MIGVATGDPSRELGLVRDALRLSDGRIVVADGVRHELRFYSPRGTFLRGVGREGEGPGEFAALIRVVPYRGDSIAAFDFGLHRISILDREGGFSRSLRVDALRPNLIGAFSDGSLIVLADSFPGTGRQGRVTGKYLRVSASGEVVGVLGPFERFAVHPVLMPGNHWTAARVPFAPYLTARMHDDRLYLGDGRGFRVDVYSPDGRWLKSLRLPGERRALDEADIVAYEQRRLEEAERPDRLQWLERMFEDTPYPDRVAAFETFHVDAEGNLWLKPYPEPGAKAVGWRVVDAGGRWLGTVEVPIDIEVLQIGSGFVLGQREADAGVHQVVVYSVTKP